ncbi:unnamed protein product [Cercopithifilaria johnstoni]|uniref:C2H2-type domain-containing protein n=1 Tax=Cercopithifilaria johnstoni TaxID=2874296 RepID=A0A8J2LWY5_9BILA|nr:unnamed protein product [Cercopithifilaria johnstoni]
MFLSYYLVLLVLPLCAAQITVSNDGDEAIEAAIRNDEEIKIMVNDSKTNEKRYKCEVCDKQFEYSSVLKRHKVTHTDERNYVSVRRAEKTSSDARKRTTARMLRVQ